MNDSDSAKHNIYDNRLDKCIIIITWTNINVNKYFFEKGIV